MSTSRTSATGWCSSSATSRAMIGDPTGREHPPPLTTKEIESNAKTYKAQVFKMLDPEKTVARIQLPMVNPWAPRADPPGGDVQRRADARAARVPPAVRRRPAHRGARVSLSAGAGVRLRRCCVPYVELGGTDQLFNLNVGRDIMPSASICRRRSS